MERQEGYYWVKYYDAFEIAEWKEGVWLLCGIDDKYSDNDLSFINENRIKYPGEISD